MTSGTAAGGVFVCRKMLRNAETCQQVRKSWEVSLLDLNFFLTSAWTAPGVPVVGRWKIEPVGIPFFDSRAIFDFLAGRLGISPALSQRLPLLSILEGDGPAAVLSGWSAAPLSGPPACCRSARCRSCRCAHPRRGVPSPAARSGQHDKVRRALCKCALWVPLSPAAAILLTAGTWSCRPLSSLDRIAGRSNLLKFCGPLQVAGERPGQYEDLLPALSAFLHFAGAKRPGSGSMTRLGGPRILFRQVRASGEGKLPSARRKRELCARSSLGRYAGIVQWSWP